MQDLAEGQDLPIPADVSGGQDLSDRNEGSGPDGLPTPDGEASELAETEVADSQWETVADVQGDAKNDSSTGDDQEGECEDGSDVGTGTCPGYYDCLTGCSKPECAAQCASQTAPDAMALVESLQSCVAAECSACGDDQDPDVCVAECSSSHCAAEYGLCFFAGGVDDCETFLECLTLCAGVPACMAECHSTVSPQGYADAAAWQKCIDEGCPTCQELPEGDACSECLIGVATGPCADVFDACFSICLADCTGKECGDDGCGGSCGTCSSDPVGPPGWLCKEDWTCASESDIVISGAELASELTALPHFGDTWLTTWADDGATYIAWGDGTARGDCHPVWSTPPIPTPCDDVELCPVFDECGLDWLFCEQFVVDCDSQCFPACKMTDLGVLRLDGVPPNFSPCDLPQSCIADTDIPSGIPLVDESGTLQTDRNDKPSSLLALGGGLVLAGHSPLLYPELGWLAWSDDHGKSWTEVPDSPWGPDSVFRVVMFVQRGQAHGLGLDGWVYAFGIGTEAGWTTDPAHYGQPYNENRTVYLARVKDSEVLNYAAWTYFTGFDGSQQPTWSPDQTSAIPVEGVETQETASIIFHPWTDRYLFLTAAPGALYEAKQPWGPWSKVADLFNEMPFAEATWAQEGYFPSVLTKDVAADHLLFTISGNGNYYLQVRRLDLQLVID